MTQILVEFFVKLLAWAMPFTLRWRYPASRIDSLILVRVLSQGDGIEFWDGDIPKARAYVEFINLSPFHLEIERAYGSFEYGADLEGFTYLRRERLSPASATSIPIEVSITKEHIDVIRRLMNSGIKPALRLSAHVVCRVRDFEIRRSIQTSHHRLVNFNITG